MLSERKILNMLDRGEISFPPFEFRLLKTNARGRDWNCDAMVETEWGGHRFAFAAEIRRYSSDRELSDAIRSSVFLAEKLSAFPLVILPWLSEDQLQRLEQERVSGIDLCGNGVIVIPKKILVVRSGKPNRYRDSRAVKNVYEGTSSLVARAFLLRPRYSSVNDIVQEIQARSGVITQPTVSKALKQLEADVVVWREKGLIRVLQADKLLERLVANTKLPSRISEIAGKVEARNVPGVMAAVAKKSRAKLMVTGACSISQYATMARYPRIEFYCGTDPSDIVVALGKEVDTNSRFPNFRLIHTDELAPFFDMRIKDGVPYASPLQCYLELMKGDKREKETAAQIRESILKASGI